MLITMRLVIPFALILTSVGFADGFIWLPFVSQCFLPFLQNCINEIKANLGSMFETLKQTAFHEKLDFNEPDSQYSFLEFGTSN